MGNHLKMAKVNAILTLHARGWSNRRIARELGIDRDAVSRHVRGASDNSKAAKAPTGSTCPVGPNAAGARGRRLTVGAGRALRSMRQRMAPCPILAATVSRIDR